MIPNSSKVKSVFLAVAAVFVLSMAAAAAENSQNAESAAPDSTIEQPIVTAERLPSDYGAIYLHLPELDTAIVRAVGIYSDSLENSRGVLLDIRSLWVGKREADSSQTPLFAAILDTLPKGPLAILAYPRWPGTEQMAMSAKNRPFTKMDFSGDPAQGQRTLTEVVSGYETGGGKTIEEMEKLRKLYPEGITPNSPKTRSE